MRVAAVMKTVWALLVFCGTSRAGYNEDFDSLTAGAIHGQDGWLANATDVVQSTVAKNGLALQRGVGATLTNRNSVFDGTTDGQLVRLQFDLNLAGTIADVAGQSGNLMNAGFLWRSESATGRHREGRIEYQGRTNSFGLADKDYFWIGGQTHITSPAPQKDVWYHCIADLDWQDWSMDVLILNPDGSTFFDPPKRQMSDVASAGSTTNAVTLPVGGNYLKGFYLDNVSITPLPEPAGAMAAAVAIILALRRRKPSLRPE